MSGNGLGSASPRTLSALALQAALVAPARTLASEVAPRHFKKGLRIPDRPEVRKFRVYSLQKFRGIPSGTDRSGRINGDIRGLAMVIFNSLSGFGYVSRHL